MIALDSQQLAVIESNTTTFLSGPAGTGKTTALEQRLVRLLRDGSLAYDILVLVTETERQASFANVVRQSGLGPYGDLTIITYNQLAMNMIELFWPIIARPAGFADPTRPPTMLSYDLAQLMMWDRVTTRIEAGAFTNLRLRPQQIVSQVLDTLNRAALNRISLEEAARRQIETWTGEPDRLIHLEDAAALAREFREDCLQNSLLDLSLAVQTFDQQIVSHPTFRDLFRERYRHLIIDNAEEQPPVGRALIFTLLDICETAAIAADTGGGFKWMLAGTSAEATLFTEQDFPTATHYIFDHSYVISEPVRQLANHIQSSLRPMPLPTAEAPDAIAAVVQGRYRRDMVQRLVATLSDQIEAGLPPAEIAIVTPYLDGALRYTLTEALKKAAIPYRLLRRRISPREEPRVRAWLTWLALAHPDWNLPPTPYDVAEALTLSLNGMDAARAELLTKHLYRPDQIWLDASDSLPNEIQSRVGEDLLSQVDTLRNWLISAEAKQPLDHFLHALFNNLLAQPPFQPEPDLAGAAVCDWLVQTAGRLRRAAPMLGWHSAETIGQTFILGINHGLVTADPPELGDPPDPNGVIIATTYGYLLAGEPVTQQVWLEAAASGWWDIPHQPLSNAFVLTEEYDGSRPWTTADDFEIRNDLMARVMLALCRRCRKSVIVAHSELDRRGMRQDGALWRILQPILPAQQKRPGIFA